MVLIEVRDTGIGIAAASLRRVFERFWQADSTSTRTHGGLGLGLALVRHIVEVHGGEVQATSPGEGCGATFVVRLPVRASATVSSEFAASTGFADRQSDRPDLRAITMLVVDDDPGARDLFTAILEGQGARVRCAGSASEAMLEFERRPVDGMIVDIGMPGEDGFALLRRIRGYEAARRLRPTPAIAVTAYAAAVDHEQALRAGFDAHTSKPILPHDLLTVVQRTVVGRTA